MRCTIEKALATLEAKPGTSIATLTTRTPVRLRKQSSDGKYLPYSCVKRLARRSVVFGANYQSCVNKQRNREQIQDIFFANELWKGKGQHVSTFVVRHTVTGRLYIAVKAQTYPNGEPIVYEEQYFGDGKPVEKTELEEFFPSLSKKNLKQKTERPTRWRTIALENIVQIVCGEIYDVVQKGVVKLDV